MSIEDLLRVWEYQNSLVWEPQIHPRWIPWYSGPLRMPSDGSSTFINGIESSHCLYTRSIQEAKGNMKKRTKMLRIYSYVFITTVIAEWEPGAQSKLISHNHDLYRRDMYLHACLPGIFWEIVRNPIVSWALWIFFTPHSRKVQRFHTLSPKVNVGVFLIRQVRE